MCTRFVRRLVGDKGGTCAGVYGGISTSFQQGPAGIGSEGWQELLLPVVVPEACAKVAG